ncbi:MAG: PhnD/SsuA/transferrin family substrate-binding protein [Actinomycetota bacterium]|nr:PhnD/SsuA/transferrin family substrate-binding protein [Actinomycetota bacterium]
MTYLSPGIPRAFYEAVVEHVRRALGQRVSLLVEPRMSGPLRGGEDPFSKGEADVGFMCTPSFFWLREREVPPVELLPAAPVFSDDRARGRPVYFSEVVVRRESPVRSFLDLRRCSWAYNDPCSLSGYYNLLKKLAEMDEDESFFGRVLCSGSHLSSMEAVARGEVDAAIIDSNVLRIKLGSSPKLRDRLRVIETWGPFPIQPVVLRSALPQELKNSLLAALLSIGLHPSASPTLAGFGLSRFVPVTYEHYAAEERALRGCENALSPNVLDAPPESKLREITGAENKATT